MRGQKVRFCDSPRATTISGNTRGDLDDTTSLGRRGKRLLPHSRGERDRRHAAGVAGN